jgi:CheY-like chemotaxis protein/two-component sensor histidine kinase
MLLEKDNPLTGEQLKRAEVLMYSGQRLLGLIDQLLEIARIEQGRRSIRVRSVNVASVLRRAVEQLQPLAERANVSLTVEIERPERAAVRADPAALEQVIVNLVSNAIKYNRPKGQVRLAYTSDDGGTIIVEDTGQGLSDSEMGHLFEPFNRLGAQHSKVPGHGLGLAITRKLVEAMDGELRVQSTPGVGSIFSVHLPVANASKFDATETLPLDLPSAWDAQEIHKVLYVEDDEVNTLLMEQIFATQPSWSLSTVASGTEALQSAVREGPQLILLDLNLPDMSGFEVFKRLQADPRTKHIPCVAVSADAMPAQVRKTLAEGFDDHWSKPLDLPLVLRKLKERLT